MANYPILGRRPVGATQILGVAAVGLGTVWVLQALIRRLVRAIWPQVFPGELNTALLASAQLNSNVEPTAKDLANVTEYDYIVVGTGTAGCVLAARLSEDPNVKVLAIEAGDSDLKQIFSRIPAGVPRLWGNPLVDWCYRTITQKDCGHRELRWPRGRMIGGCSSNNAMMYNKGAPEDFDEWATLGNEGWDYKSLIPYMKKAEHFHQPRDGDYRKLPADDLAQHGQSGPWQITYPPQAKITTVFPDACDAVGIPKVSDINTDRGMIGACAVQTFIDTKGQRSSAAAAYLTEDVVKRPNLKIASGQVVTKIIFDTTGSKPRAVGVQMASSKVSPVRYLVKANKEVLLASGAIGSPHLLKVSGIGSKEELDQHGIPLVKELPGVGENLMDHMAYHGVVMKTDKNVSNHYLQNEINSLPAIIEWLRHGTGPASGGGADSFAFVHTADREDAPASLRANDRTSGPNAPDLELIALSLCFAKHGRFIAPQTSGYATLSAVALRPESKGTVRLVSSNIFDSPLLDPKALSTDYDIDMLLFGAKLCAKIARSGPYKQYFKGFYQGPHHPIDWDNSTDDEIRAHIRTSCETLYHPMGTAKMGRDADAVVDDKLKVHGVEGLRVVDASIFPTALACHPCAPVITVAERAADLIKHGQ